jgi:endonuclease I
LGIGAEWWLDSATDQCSEYYKIHMALDQHIGSEPAVPQNQQFQSQVSHWETQSIQSSAQSPSSRQHIVNLNTLQASLLNINSELMNYELNIQSNQEQHLLEEYAKTSTMYI